jgi:hypothetical protein
LAEVRPTFFIIGAPKAGTTSLYHYLKNHPQVVMSSVKEPNFFSFPELEKQKLYYKDDSVNNEQEYLQLFNNNKAQAKAIGEASVSYLFYPGTALRIKSFQPDAKIIVMLRNPFDRAWSHYLMDYKLNYVRDTFDNIATKRVNGHKNNQHFQQYIELGLYYKQLKNYIDVFGKEQLYIGIYDDLKSDTQKVFDEICRFLDINKMALSETPAYNSAEVPRNYIIRSLYASDNIRRGLKKMLGGEQSRKIKSILFKKPEMKAQDETRKYLNELFAEDLRNTEILTGLNLKAWYETT